MTRNNCYFLSGHLLDGGTISVSKREPLKSHGFSHKTVVSPPPLKMNRFLMPILFDVKLAVVRTRFKKVNQPSLAPKQALLIRN